MKIRQPLCNSVRCDNLIGFLVAFEKRTKTMETCCDNPIEIIDSNDSTSFSIHPAYIRHKHAARRASRGRSRIPVQNKVFAHSSKNEIDDSFTGTNIKQNFGTDTSGQSLHESDRSDLMVLALAEEVEVVIETKNESIVATESRICHAPLDSLESMENERNQDILDQQAASSSCASSPIAAYNGKVSCRTKKEETGEDKSSALVLPLRNSSKLNELLLTVKNNKQGDRSTCREFIPLQKQSSEKENKTIVVFRDPISEVIPTAHGFVIGDLVDIQNGKFNNKTGRVIRVYEDLVLVTILGEFIKPLYLSPSMLRLTKVSKIIIVY